MNERKPLYSLWRQEWAEINQHDSEKFNCWLNRVDSYGWTFLNRAVLRIHRYEEWYCSLRDLTDFSDDNWAVRNYFRDVIKRDKPPKVNDALVSLALDVLEQQKHSLSPIIMAARCGADLNLPDAFGWRPLHLAVRYQRASAIVQLVEEGADPNAFAKIKINGEFVNWTPLHMAAGFDLLHARDIIHYLVSRGADLSLKDHLGRTPYMLAKELGHKRAENAILRRMSKQSKHKLLTKLDVISQDVALFFASRKREKMARNKRQGKEREN